MAEEIPLVTSATNVFGKKSKPGVNYEIYQENLLDYLKEENLGEFTNLLAHKDTYKINLNHVYGDKCNKTCLAEASKRGLTEFMKALLNNGADPNFICPLHLGQTSIHFAAEEGQIKAIECLAYHPATKINAIDFYGNTALHLLASNLTVEGKKAEQCFAYLAGLENTDIRHKNENGESAISMAVGNCSEHIWVDVLKLHDLRLEDMQQILRQHPELEEYSRDTVDLYTYDDAFTDLKNENFEIFKENFKEEFFNMTELIDATFLQQACILGKPDIVQFLLDRGAEVNQTGPHETRPPVYIACFYGHYDILVRLFKTNKVVVEFVQGNSLLHGVLQGFIHSKKHTDDYRKCFDYLLKEKNPQIPINHCDDYGHTALHYAAIVEDSHYTKALLEQGAYIGYLNEFGFSPLHDIGPQTLEEILDNCLECTKTDKENQYNLRFNFNMLKPTDGCDTTKQTKDAESGNCPQEILPEMLPLYFISQSNKFGHLLKHPVLLMFLHLKWTRICLLFYMNMIYYITFVIFLTVVVLSETYAPGIYNGNSEQIVVWVILLVLTVVLVVRELIQFCLLPKKWRYFCNLDNILEVCIIATTIAILAGNSSRLLAAVTLLLAWMEVILQLGCIHSLAVYNEIMKKVTFSYVKFLLWYFPLILAFSFSFYKLYHDKNPPEAKNGTFNDNRESGKFSAQDDKFDFYSNTFLSLLKTVVMMIGEFDASNMDFDNNEGRYFVFLFFVFMMTIVLMNLLNGLAVSDIQAIKNDAELVAHRSRVKLVHHFESVVFGVPLFNRRSYQTTGGSPLLCCPWKRGLQKAISLFPDTFTDGYLSAVLNHKIRYINLKIEKRDSVIEFRPDTCCSVGKYRMGLYVEREVLIAAKDIVDRRKKQSQHENNQIANRIAKVEEDLQGCIKQLANLEGLLKQLINNSGQK